LNKLTGLLPSVNIIPCKLRLCNNLACISGPALAIDLIVSGPIAATVSANFFVSIIASSLAFETSKVLTLLRCSISAF